MSDKEIIQRYTDRKQTIRELAAKSGLSYSKVRKILVKAGFHNTKH